MVTNLIACYSSKFGLAFEVRLVCRS